MCIAAEALQRQAAAAQEALSAAEARAAALQKQLQDEKAAAVAAQEAAARQQQAAVAKREADLKFAHAKEVALLQTQVCTHLFLAPSPPRCTIHQGFLYFADTTCNVLNCLLAAHGPAHTARSTAGAA